jgi:lysophospholipase L1-like esterase
MAETRRVLLLGDFIRLAYQPHAEHALTADRTLDVRIVAPAASTGTSADLAEGIDEWLRRFNPDAVHFNAGLEDVCWIRAERRNVVGPGEYEMNLRRVVDACRMRVGGDIVFALTTPVIDEKQCDRPGSACDRLNREIDDYNAIAERIMVGENILLNRLDHVVGRHDEEYLAEDGVSLSPDGAVAVGKAVATCIRTLWH